MFERKIGDVFTIESRGVTLQVVEGWSCKDCYLYCEVEGMCERQYSEDISKYVGACTKIWRADKKFVNFKKV